MVIDFNKYSMGGGSGGGGGQGSDPNAVKYTEQSLTDAQKAQARTNIGATSPEIFWATYGTTTVAEIDAAVSAGKAVMCSYGGNIYPLVQNGTSSSYYYFQVIINNTAPYLLLKVSDSTWVRGSVNIQKSNDRVSTITGNETNTDKYPSTIAVADYVGLLSNLVTTDKSNLVAAVNEIAGNMPVIPVDTAIPSGGLDANVHYDLGTLTGSVSITLDTTSEVSGMLNIYSLAFTAGSTAPTITWPSGITSWAGNCLDATTMAPVITGGNSYEVSIVDGMAVITEFVA